MPKEVKNPFWMNFSINADDISIREQPCKLSLVVLMAISIVMRMCALRSRNVRHDAAAPPRAILHAGKQAIPIRLAASGRGRRRAVQARRSRSLLAVVVCRIEAVLGLDRGAVDSVVVQARPHLPGELHVLVTAGG